MRQLIETVMEFFSWCLRVLLRRSRSQWWQEEVYEAGSDKEDILAPLNEEGGYRQRVVHVIGPNASTDGIGWDEEELKYVENGAVQTKILYREVKRCDCGAVLAYTNNVLGTCTICSRVICKEEGCGARCKHCGALVCKRHSVQLCERTFCSRHRIYGLWLLFWGVRK